MSTRLIYLQEDKTGLAPDNLVQGELHTPPPGKQRLVVPRWGAFYKDSLVVTDSETNLEVDKSLIKMGDAFPYGIDQSGKDIYTCFVVDEAAPASILITAQYYGGPQSRNAHEIIKWLNERMEQTGTMLNYSDLIDLPKEWDPVWHNHLLAHVYGMEYLVGSIDRLATLIKNDKHEVLEEQYQRAKVRLKQMEQAAYTTAEAVVEVAWRKWQEEMSLFNLGIDLLKNYPALGSGGALVARPAFALDNEEDERYVDLAGLGSFNRALVERVVRSQTNLGLANSVMVEAQRGSFVGALVGETFTLPSPREAKKLLYVKTDVYPPDFPEDDQLVVVKVAANNNNLGGVFTVFNQRTGDQWVGLLFNDTWLNPLIYQKVYYEDMSMSIGEALENHIAARGAVHEETKAQLGLGLVENLPTGTMEELLVGEYPRKLLTYELLLAYWRMNMEGIHLKRLENGEIDYDEDTMDKMRVIINSGACGPTVAPKDQFLSSFCDGGDKWVRMTDGLGGYYDKISEQKSADCNYTAKPEYGKLLSQYCENTNLIGRYSDGLGGSTTEILKVNSTDCGYVAPPPMGSILAVFCVGVNQTTRYADGKGGTYDMVSMVDTYLCGGKIYAGTGTGGGQTVIDPKIVFSSTHSKLTANTTEFISFYATKFAPNSRYLFEIFQTGGGAEGQSVLYSGSFTTTSNGAYLWEQERFDDGKSTKRGAYVNWVRVASENVESNKIDRNFIDGATETPPDDTGNAGGGNAGGGNTGETDPPKNVNGDPYGADNKWPPTPLFDPKIILATDRPTLFVGTNETMTATMTGFLADTDVNVTIWYQHPKLSNGAAVASLPVKIRTDARGMATYRVHNYDDGSIPRGTTTDWAEAKAADNLTVKSPNISRVWSEGTEGMSKWRQLSVVSSHSQVNIGTAYTHSVTLTGAAPNTLFVIELRRSQYSGTIAENGVLISSTQIKTNGSGVGLVEFTDVYDGVTPPPRNYQFYARLSGMDQMSTIASVNFVAQPANQTGRGILTFNSSIQDTVRPGMTETLTATITNGTPSKTVTIQHWNQSTSFNGGQAAMSDTSEMRIGSNGIGVSTVSRTDRGAIDTPRGLYESWVVCPEENLVSRRIARNFVTETGQTVTPVPTTMQLGYKSSTNTVTPGVLETHTLTVTSGPKNSIVFCDMMFSGPALNNGNTPIKSTTISVPTNSNGDGSATTESNDNGVYPPRGTYSCWITANGVVSPNWSRTFTGTPPPTIPFNPKAVYSSSSNTISPGMFDQSYVDLTGFRAHTSYSVEFWVKGANLFNGNADRLVTILVVTDANGAARAQTEGANDNGSLVPRGSYANWAVITETGTVSNTTARNFIGTPAPTAPPYSPYLRYYTSEQYIYKGTVEKHTLTMSGMKPNTGYWVAVYIQSPALFNGAVYESTTKLLTTDAAGTASLSWWADPDNGIAVPRGTYANWAKIVETGTTSSVFNRYFL